MSEMTTQKAITQLQYLHDEIKLNMPIKEALSLAIAALESAEKAKEDAALNDAIHRYHHTDPAILCYIDLGEAMFFPVEGHADAVLDIFEILERMHDHATDGTEFDYVVFETTADGESALKKLFEAWAKEHVICTRWVLENTEGVDLRFLQEKLEVSK